MEKTLLIRGRRIRKRKQGRLTPNFPFPPRCTFLPGVPTARYSINPAQATAGSAVWGSGDRRECSVGLDTAVPSGPWRYSDYAVRYTLRHSSVGDGEAHVCARRASGTLLIVAEKEALVRDYPILQQEGAILLFEGDLPVVLFLPQYVADNHVLVAQTVAESGILMTPTAP